MKKVPTPANSALGDMLHIGSIQDSESRKLNSEQIAYLPPYFSLDMHERKKIGEKII